jgi:hypothetical protein
MQPPPTDADSFVRQCHAPTMMAEQASVRARILGSPAVLGASSTQRRGEQAGPCAFKLRDHSERGPPDVGLRSSPYGGCPLLAPLSGGVALDSSSLLSGHIDAAIPGSLTLLGIRRRVRETDAAVFGPAMLLLNEFDPDIAAMAVLPDRQAELDRWRERATRLNSAREQLLVIAAGHPRRQVREGAERTQVALANAARSTTWVVRDITANPNNPDGMTQARAALSSVVAAHFWRWPVRRRAD